VPIQLAVGTQFAREGLSTSARVRETGGAARVDSYARAAGPIAREALRLGIRSSVGCPIVVGGRIGGVIATSSNSPFCAPGLAVLLSAAGMVIMSRFPPAHPPDHIASRGPRRPETPAADNGSLRNINPSEDSLMTEPVRRTRRDLLRTLTVGGVAIASATLLEGCGLGSTTQTVTPAPLPPPGHTGALIMIIRHGEKPPASGGPQGIDADGKPDTQSLTVRGWTRAGALVELFAPGSGATRSGLARPTAIYASGGTSGEGQRPRQTVTPLATRLGIPINTQFSKGGESALARAAASRTEPTLLCWQHGELPTIATALATVTPAPPTPWPDNRFDLVWVLTPAAAGWSFNQIPQLLLDGDSNQPIT
jgi:hypothetical protein